MEIPNFIYPKYYDILLYKDNNEEINIDNKLYNNFIKLPLLKKLQKDNNIFANETKKNYIYYTKKLTKEQLKNKEEPIFDFTGNNKIYKEVSKKINEDKGFTNAWRKIYEICQKTDFIPNNKNIYHFDICCMPGAFILGINHYLKTIKDINKYDWYGQSLIAGKNEAFFEDKYDLFKKNEDRLLVGVERGDITIKENIKYYQYFFKDNKRNIVTSDCGLPGTESYNYTREHQMAKIFLGQFLAGISVLKKNGNFVMKTYNFFSNLYISIIYLMSLCFKEVRLVKPESSRQPRGKEIYILCLNYKNNIDNNIQDKLLNILENINNMLDIEKTIISYENMDKEIIKKIQENLCIYYNDYIIRIKEEKEFIKNYIKADIIKETKLYLKNREKMKKYFRKYVLDYVDDFIFYSYYKRIKNKDKLI